MRRTLAELLSSRLEIAGRPEVPEPMYLVDRDRTVLRALHEHRFLTTSMIATFCWGTHSTRLSTRLKRMHHAHLVRRFRPANLGPRGRLEWVYEIDELGVAELQGAAADWREPELRDFAYVEHDLELNGLMIEICVAATQNATEPPADALPFEWLGERSGLVVPTQERRPLDAHPESEAPPSARFIPGFSATGWIDPDATLIGRARRGADNAAILIEYDRTRRASKLVGKLQRYDWFLTSGWRNTRYARLATPPLVLFITRSEAQLPSVLHQASEVLTARLAYDDRPGETFTGRDRIGFLSADRLDAGDSAVDRVSAAPGQGNRRSSQLHIADSFHG